MGWRTQQAAARLGPHLLLVASVMLAIVLIHRHQGIGVPGYAEVAPVRLSSLEAGRVDSIAVTEGDLVAPGDLVAVLDDTLVSSRARVLEAELDRLGAAVEESEEVVRATLRRARAAREETQARLAGARAELKALEARLEERRRQVEAGLESRARLAEVEADLAPARAEVQRLEATLRHAAPTDEPGTAGEPTVAPAVLERARARAVVQEELQALERRREELTLEAPVGARVSVVHFRAGEVAPAQTPVVELVPLSTSTVVACLPEAYPVEVKTGTRTLLEPQSGGDPVDGVVVQIAGLVSAAPERCKQRPNEMGWVRPVRIQVADGTLVPGQRFRVRFVSAEEEPS